MKLTREKQVIGLVMALKEKKTLPTHLLGSLHQSLMQAGCKRRKVLTDCNDEQVQSTIYINRLAKISADMYDMNVRLETLL